ncbi:MAG: LytR/AlgR family response regulator transcription factor [Alistipes shahii]|uniref:LytR/AlgR family response regulator transcription factor n=1 Tax=Alistipes shahii TaxID=328814 RepID=UPI00399D3E12
MKAIIIEDEPLSAAELRTSLAECAPQIEVVATASSVAGRPPKRWAGVEHDLIFMDIHLEDGSGFDIFERADITVPVIFITAYDSYALKAFENKGIDYLLKPFGLDDLRRAIDSWDFCRGESRLRARRSMQTPPVLPGTVPGAHGRPDAIRSPRQRSPISWPTASTLHLMTHDGKDYILDRSLTDVGEKLPPNLFFRINRRFHRLVRRHPGDDHVIREAASRSCSTRPLAEGEEAFVSTDRVPDFREWLNR